MPVSVSTKTHTFTNGTANDAGPVDSEFTNTFNSLANVKTKIDNLLSGKIEDGLSIIIRQAFTGSPGASDHLSLIAERGSATNTAIRWNESNDWWEVTHNGSAYYPLAYVSSSDPASPTEGMIWFNTTDHALRYFDGTTIQTVISGTSLPKLYSAGPPPLYVSASTVKIPAGTLMRDATDTADISVTSDLSVALTTSGANGLDTGAEASNTWYYLYVIKKSSDGTVAGLFSTVDEAVSGSVTLPSGFDLKRQTRLAVRNDNSANILKFYWADPYTLLYDSDFTGDSSDPTSIGGGPLTASSFTVVDASAFIPSGIARVGLFHFEKNSTEAVHFRPGGSTATNGLKLYTSDNNMKEFQCGVSATGEIDYKVLAGNIELAVRGFIVTEHF